MTPVGASDIAGTAYGDNPRPHHRKVDWRADEAVRRLGEGTVGR